jgi:probable HAF family extracellular repeat protein
MNRTKLAVAGVLAAGALLTSAASAHAATEYQLTIGNSPVLDNANQTASLNAINNLGTPVGNAFFPDLSDSQATFGGDFQRLSIPGDAKGTKHVSDVFDINDSGTAVGFAQQSNLDTETGFGVERPFAWDNGAVGRPLDVLPGKSVEPHSINNAGDIVGFSFTGNGLTGTTPKTTGFLLGHDGTFSALAPLPGGKTSKAAAINASGVIVGQADQGTIAQQFATTWRDGVPTSLGGLPGATFGAALNVNADGAAVGFSTDLHGNHAVLYAGGTVTDLNFPTFGTGKDVKATAINDAGTVVGTGDTFTGRSVQPRAVRFQAGQTQDLNTLIAPGSGYTLKTAFDVNDAGQIVGTASPDAHPDQTLGYILTPTH